MVKCNYCGTELNEGALFCKKCGQRLNGGDGRQAEKADVVRREWETQLNLAQAALNNLRRCCAADFTAGDKVLEELREENTSLQKQVKELTRALKQNEHDFLEEKKALERRVASAEAAAREVERQAAGVMQTQPEAPAQSDGSAEVPQEATENGPAELSKATSACPHCGAEITDDMLFCGECGVRLKET